MWRSLPHNPASCVLAGAKDQDARYQSPSAETNQEDICTVIFTIASSGCSILWISKRNEFRDPLIRRCLKSPTSGTGRPPHGHRSLEDATSPPGVSSEIPVASIRPSRLEPRSNRWSFEKRVGLKRSAGESRCPHLGALG